ncbi:hypothetical protein [Siphonobacter curvatus]|uniref:Transmembrane Fragile-X-F protein n=1 Tax=Siphonobacter curvatus TaxID=2094562 RepID=A0A2S7ING1_9BACT|nr:hypothetical protein [Siphonobacter curvatus]PQA59148.1 hypothetical protein C5O19_05695 [Siphonobacter curvatus]
MAKSESSSQAQGVGFFGLLFLVFLVLKLLKVITWSWWWVTAPLWGGFAFAIVALIIFLIGYFIKILIESKRSK